MGDGDAVADARGAEALALEQHVEDGPLLRPSDLGGALGELLQRLFLARRAQARDDTGGADQIGDIHGALKPGFQASLPLSGSTQPMFPSLRR